MAEKDVPEVPPRIRDYQRAQKERKRYASDEPEAQKMYNERKKARKAQGEGRMECKIKYYTQDASQKVQLQNKLDQVKILLGEGTVSSVSNLDALNSILDFYLDSHKQSAEPVVGDDVQQADPVSNYQTCSATQANEEDIYLLSRSSISHLLQQIAQHNDSCNFPLTMKDVTRLRHAGICTLTCKGACKPLRWSTSPHVGGGKYLVNIRMIHAYMMSGILPVQYERLCMAANIGHVANTYMEPFTRLYSETTESLAEQSMQNAIAEEKAASGSSDGINILTDARHGWRKNAKDTDVVCIGEKKHRILNVQHVTKHEEPSSQKHELVGVKRMYDYFDTNEVSIKIHAHDANASVTKFIKNERPGTENNNDTWHVTKGITKELKKITSGPKRDKNKTWHPELSDKAGAIRTHAYWAMKNCEGSADKLVGYLDNIPNHYKGIHDGCHVDSRCRSGPHYKSTKCRITDPVAEQLLVRSIKKLALYKRPHDYIHCLSTHYVESFNNMLLIHQDKRIVFGDKEYRRRTMMAVMEWNENVDREIYQMMMISDVPLCHPSNNKLVFLVSLIPPDPCQQC